MSEKSRNFAATVLTALRLACVPGWDFYFFIINYSKLPLDYPDQIAVLKSRGLTIHNEDAAIRELGVISYFRLASYWRPMETDKETHAFKPGSRFDNAVSLYYFDKGFRRLLFSTIQTLEIALRTKMIHFVSMKHGAFWFMDSGNFTDKALFHTHIQHIEAEVMRSKEEFMQEHFAKYSSPKLPPVWKTLEVVSFGSLSKLYANLSDIAVKKQIARELGLPQHLYLESWIKSLTVLRNCIAHHARVWNRQFAFTPQMPTKLKGAWLTTVPTSRKVYTQLCALKYIEDVVHPGNTFAADLKSMLAEYPMVDTRAMGFPANWQSEPLWK